MEACLKRRRDQRNVNIKRWARFKRLRLAREVPESGQAPLRPALIGHGQFVPGDVEGRAVVFTSISRDRSSGAKLEMS